MTPVPTMQPDALRAPRRPGRRSVARVRRRAPAAGFDVAYRKLWPADRSAIAAHLKRLPPQDRRLRFMGYVGDTVIDRYCDGLDWHHSVLIGAFIDGVLRGVVHVALGERSGDEAEIGLSVEPSFQGRRIGSELFERSLLSARNRSAVSVRVNCLAENQKMRRIAGKLTEEAGHCGDGLSLVVRQDAPDALSQMQEAMADGLALARVFFDPSNWMTYARTAP